MCSIDAHEKYHKPPFNDGSSCGRYALPSNSTTEALVSLSETINLIDFWTQGLEHNSLERSNMYFETTKNMFKKIPVELPKPLSHKEKRQSLLHYIGGGW